MSADISNKISIYNINCIPMIYDTEGKEDKIINEINLMIENDEDTNRCIDELDEWGSDEFTWRNKNEFMTELSKKYPFIVFAVDSNYYGGEEFERMYYQDGKSHVADVITTFEDFDKDKLR